MTANLIPFTYQDQPVRVVEIDGEPWFVLADLCRVLDIANPRDTAQRITPESVGTADVLDSRGVSHPTNIVDEPGMYEVVFLSRKPEAVTFRRWITTEVLPSIRKTGGYGVPQLTGPELLARALIEAQRTLQDAEQRAQVAEDKVKVLEPKATYVDTYVADDDLRLIRNVAKSIGVGEYELRHALVQHNWIYQESSTRWSQRQQEKVTDYRYSPYADKRRYFRPVPNHEAPRFRGEVMHTLKVTPEGAVAIAKAARIWGLTGEPGLFDEEPA